MKSTHLLSAVGVRNKQARLDDGFSMRTSINATIARLVLLVAGCLVAAAVNAAAIQRVNFDGTELTTLVTMGLDFPAGIALDVAGDQMYWADGRTGKIQRANLDGSGMTDLVIDQGQAIGVALDVADGQMYWTVDSGGGEIQRVNLDGSGVTRLVNGSARPISIALDLVGGQMYWSDVDTGFKRANLDGSGVTDLGISSISLGIDLDVGSDKIYWADVFGAIGRANLDGSGMEFLVTGIGGIEYGGFALDLAGDQMYWLDRGTFDQGTGNIWRANLDGTGMTRLVTGLTDPIGIALDPDAGHIYYSSQFVPLPASVWLFVSGLIGLIGLARRKS